MELGVLAMELGVLAMELGVSHGTGCISHGTGCLSHGTGRLSHGTGCLRLASWKELGKLFKLWLLLLPKHDKNCGKELFGFKMIKETGIFFDVLRG